MRCRLMTREGILLGELVLAEGVNLADVGRALLDGTAAAVAVVEPAPPGDDATKDSKRKPTR